MESPLNGLSNGIKKFMG